VHRSLGFSLLFLVSTTFALAQPSSTTRLIPYAATAANPDGRPLTGEVDLTFALFEKQ
jgi:hypothetical protein